MSTAGADIPNPRLSPRRPDPEDRNRPAHERLLDAVLCLMVEDGVGVLAEGFKPGEVARRAGKSRASYYRTEQFPASEADSGESRIAVLEAAIERALQKDVAAVTRRIDAVPHQLEEGVVLSSPEESIRVAARANFRTVQQSMFSTRLYAAALATSSVTIEASLRRHYEVLTESLVNSYRQTLQFWGRDVRPSLDLRQYVLAMIAVSDGLILRYCADDSVDAEMYADLLAAVGAALLAPVV